MIIPVLLRCFLHSGVVRTGLLRAISMYLEGGQSSQDGSIKDDVIDIDQDPINFIVCTFVLLAESNTVLMSTRLPEDDKSITDIVKTFRVRFQVLL